MNNTYEYKRFMRDGSVELKTGIIRSRSKKKKEGKASGKTKG